MANRYKGEVPFPQAGKGAFIRFDLEDLAELEDLFGRNFFGVIEEAAFHASPRDLPKCLAIGLKTRDASGKVERIWDGLDKQALTEGGFKIGDAGRPILDAIAQSHFQKSYDDLVDEAVEARKKADAEKVKRVKEAAEEAGLPFNEALSDGLFKLLTELASTPSQSGG